MGDGTIFGPHDFRALSVSSSKRSSAYSKRGQKPAKLALRATMLRTAGTFAGVNSSLRRLVHINARPAPLDSVVNQPTATSPQLVLPENENNSNIFPNSPFIWGSMELMAVPKKKVSPHKRGIRNGPKALKPVPVIIRCKACGRVKLPHFFCCSGIKQNPGEENNSTG